MKAVTRSGGDFIYLFSIMRKQAGVDPPHGDWRFVEYARGSAAEPFREIARDAACWGCHGGAAPTDWVFTPLQ